jgi:hypothetical protein
MGAWVVVMVLMGQSDGGVSPPPPPPEVIPEGVTFPRVLRMPGKVCVESLEPTGAVKSECRVEGSGTASPMKAPVPTEPASRLVWSLNVLGGTLLTGFTLPELSFSADVGVRFRSGVGVVGFLHSGFARAAPRPGLPETVLHRYSAGGALRLGDRTHVLLGLGPGLMVVYGLPSPALTVIARISFVLVRYFAISLMPTITVGSSGAVASISLGLGFSF